MRHIGNVNAHFNIAIRQYPKRQRIVKILGIKRVNRKSRHVAEIAANIHTIPLSIGSNSRRIVVNNRRFCQNIVWKFNVKAIIYQNRLHFDVARAGLPQYGSDFAKQPFVLRHIPIGDVNDDFFAIFGIFRIVHADINFWHINPIGRNHRKLPRGIKNTDKMIHRVFQHRNHLAIGSFAPTRRKIRTHFDRIAVHRAHQQLGRYENIRFQTIANHVSRPIFCHIDSPFVSATTRFRSRPRRTRIRIHPLGGRGRHFFSPPFFAHQ